MARKKTFYRQCRLVKQMERAEAVQMSWIPATFAELGRVLRLRDADKSWDDGWTVREVGLTLLPEDSLPDFHTLSKAHLRATGDAGTVKG